jgi:phage terminase large subunit-like protein
MAPASALLHQLVVEGRLRHGRDPELDSAARTAGVRDTAFGWRLDKTVRSGRIDALVALAMAAYISEAEAGVIGPHVIIV